LTASSANIPVETLWTAPNRVPAADFKAEGDRAFRSVAHVLMKQTVQRRLLEVLRTPQSAARARFYGRAIDSFRSRVERDNPSALAAWRLFPCILSSTIRM
jgi:hypothetical protein